MNTNLSQKSTSTSRTPQPVYSDTITNHWFDCATQHQSPFCNPRPQGQEVTLLVIHAISLPEGKYHTDYVRQLFMGTLDPDGECGHLAQMEVSSHLFIRRDGTVLQFVPCNLRAWHAGDSSHDTIPDCNDYSLGIELEGTDHTPFTAHQYTSLVHTTACLMQHYPAIKPQRIVGHCDIALPQGRKTDPGKCFDWHGYTHSLRNLLATTTGTV